MDMYTKESVATSIQTVSKRSALSAGVCIFELGNLNQLVSEKVAEEIRGEFTKHGTPIKQLSNVRQFTSWTSNLNLVHNLDIKYIPKETYNISSEVLIFDDTVAIYRMEPEPFYLEINDTSYAQMMRDVFTNMWYLGDNLLLAADGSTLTKQYLPISHVYKSVPVVMYPAKDDGVLENAFSRLEVGAIETYVNSIIESDLAYHKDAGIVLAYVWNQGTVPYCDVWKITRNTISDDSGFLYDVRVYEDTKMITTMGVASGNSSIVLAAEEILLRDLMFTRGLSFEEAANRQIYQARFPIGFVPAESFYR